MTHGGRLTDGMRINFSGRLYDVVSHHVAEGTHRAAMARPAAGPSALQPSCSPTLPHEG
ncbi:hypothetical protein [Georgenia ruanii]|uniref:hypothetical protein n=1 Tax=Georgenia ruanii TaxID=348442 RepID=UPI003CD07D2D